MVHSGSCHCGAIRYELSGEPQVVALCHCSDCRRSAGAPFVSWAMYPETSLTLRAGTPKTINSSGTSMRSFCPDCGTGLFYRNEAMLPGIVDIQAATLDDPNAMPPAIHIQTAERLGWVSHMNELPEYERFPI
jgi:hypothetical protein